MSTLKRTIALVITLALIISALSGCLNKEGGAAAPSDSAAPTDNAAPTATVSGPNTDDRFSLRYWEGETFNPLSGMNSDNMNIATLMYEGLFTLDTSFAAQPVLCESYATTDGVMHTLGVMQNVKFTDGTPLTAEDVVYSINFARECEKYASRLSGVTEVTALDDKTVSVTLGKANYDFPALLDIPIVKDGTAESTLPTGTGMYTLTNGDDPYLTAFSGHRDYESAPIETIYLRTFPSAELAEAVSDGVLDLLWEDPGGIETYSIQINHEERDYNTTIFEYIGFNISSAVMGDIRVRQAINTCIDREYIVNSALGGHALMTKSLMSPAYKYFDSNWGATQEYTAIKIEAMLFEAGFRDVSGDGIMELDRQTYEIKFLVCSDNDHRLRAAQRIADDLLKIGLKATLVSLPWEEYVAALTEGSFDMYYADVKIPATFDFTEMLTEGGSLNFGKIKNENYETLISAFLAASTESAKMLAAKNLCQAVTAELSIIPIAYRSYTVHSLYNVISGLAPTQTSIFSGFSGFTINP